MYHKEFTKADTPLCKSVNYRHVIQKRRKVKKKQQMLVRVLSKTERSKRIYLIRGEARKPTKMEETKLSKRAKGIQQ
jgi:hypothetical protein